MGGRGWGRIFRLAGSGWQGGADGVEHADSARVKAIAASELGNSRMSGSKLGVEGANALGMTDGPLVGHILNGLSVFFCRLMRCKLGFCGHSRMPLVPKPYPKQKNAQGDD
jgi:hypothetical protein